MAPHLDRPASFTALHHIADEVARRNRHIYDEMLLHSQYVRTGNFTSLGTADLRLLFDLYDARFFDGLLGRMLREDGVGEVTLRPSARMTRAAGKTYMRRERRQTLTGVVERVEYEIAVSTLLLAQNFREPGRLVTVGDWYVAIGWRSFSGSSSTSYSTWPSSSPGVSRAARPLTSTLCRGASSDTREQPTIS
ncbi:hypothetical protein V5E97_33965 [Singulisphaera sp. Ch08]|uniref:Uncharacterized protein n=1 Tax=Singulisphaera sp. Ch08 TaxID=3120278 RepID=A0AAU7CCX4_9BACT